MFQTSKRIMWPALLLLMWEGVPLAGSQCERFSAVSFSVSSWRNQTGHRLVAAEMRSDDSLEDAVSLSVDQWTERCGAAGIVALSVTASSAGSSNAATTSVLISTVPTPPVTVRRTPRPDYRHLPGLGYYKPHMNTVPWEEARRICESEGAHLAVVDSNEKFQALFKLSGPNPWIGIHRQDSSSPWVTALGQPLQPGFDAWQAGEPMGRGDCAFIGSSGIADYPCNAGDRFICELKV